MSILISPHPHQHLLSCNFFILAVLVGVNQYLIVVLICISLMTEIKDVEQKERCWASFHVLVGYLYLFLWEMSVHIPCSFINYHILPCINAQPRFWPKLAGKKIFPFNILIQYFIYLYLGTKPIIFQNIILHMDIIIAFQSYTFNA